MTSIVNRAELQRFDDPREREARGLLLRTEEEGERAAFYAYLEEAESRYSGQYGTDEAAEQAASEEHQRSLTAFCR